MARGAFALPGIQVRGKLGGMVFIPQPGGRMTVRRAPTFTGERTPGQRASAGRFRPVADAWNDLTIEEAVLWRRYGQGLGAKPDGRAVQPNNAFTALGTKLLQMRPGAALPRVPPTEGFLGDGIRVGASATSLPLGRGRGGVDGLSSESEQAEGATTPSLPSPRGEEPNSILFTASGPNAEGVVTELLLQRLKSRLRTPVGDRYRTAAFVAFAPGSLTATVPCGKGAVAVAIRFVRADSGQESAIVPLGVFELG